MASGKGPHTEATEATEEEGKGVGGKHEFGFFPFAFALWPPWPLCEALSRQSYQSAITRQAERPPYPAG